jgi:hypothetical protein
MARAVADGRRPANVGASDYAAVERMRRVFRAPHAELQEVRRIIAGVSGGSTPINAGPCPADLVDLTFQVEVASNQGRKEPLVGRIWKLARLLEPAGGSRLEATVLLPWRRIPSITTWALLGDYRLDGPQGCPSSRLMRLFRAVINAADPATWSGDLHDGESVESIWDRWTKGSVSRPGVPAWLRTSP